MKYSVLLLILLQCMISLNYSAQIPENRSCRLTMVIPNHFVNAGKEEGMAMYKSKKNKTSLTMLRESKAAQDKYRSAQEAADMKYKVLKQQNQVIDLSVVQEKIGKTDFVVVSWLELGQRKRATACMTAYNSDCELIYTFEMNSLSSSKKELDKMFRGFLKSCKRYETK